MKRVRFSKIAVLLCLASATLLAQVETGRIIGTVTDSSSAAVPGASVTIQNVGTGRSFTVTTDEHGLYRSIPLPAGVYRVEIEAAGFKKAVRQDITLQVQQTVVADVPLEVGAISEQIDVKASVPLLSTTEASQGQVIDERRVVNLPLNGRDYIQLALLSEGASEPTGGRIGGFSSGGMLTTKNNYLIDGIDNNSNQIAAESSQAEAVKPSIDAIQEFKVQTNAYSAEFGRAAGGVINLTIKSGTNQLHGTAYEFLRNENLDARNFFDSAGVPPFKRNQYGFSVGGPVIKNKTFFFGSYERLARRESRTVVANLPSLKIRQGDFSELNKVIYDPLSYDPQTRTRQPLPGNLIPSNRIDPLAKQIVGLYPVPQNGGLTRNFFNNPASKEDTDHLDLRFDHTIRATDSIYFRISRQQQDLPASLTLPPPAFGGGAWFKNSGYNTGLTWNRIFSPSLFSSLRLGWNFLRADRRNPAESIPMGNLNKKYGVNGVDQAQPGGFASFAPAGYQTIGIGTANPLVSDSQTRQFVHDTTWTRGRHSVKFGTDVRRIQMNIFNIRSLPGAFTFDGSFTRNLTTGSGGDAMADFLYGWPQSTGISTPISLNGRSWFLGGYIQDEWRVRPNFTLNVGLRYEWFRPFEDRFDRMANFDMDTNPSKPALVLASQASERATISPDNTNFAPRVGFAWELKPKLVVRGGYGIFYEFPQPVGDAQFLIGNLPFAYTVTIPTDGVNPAYLLKDGVPANVLTLDGVTGTNPSSYQRNPSLGYAQQWNLNIQNEFAPGWMLQVGYFGATGTHLFLRKDGNPVVTLAPGNRDTHRLYPSMSVPGTDRVLSPLGAVNRHEWSGNSAYHSLQAKIEHQFSSGFTLLSSYIFSRSLSNQLGFTTSGDAQGSGYQNLLDFRQERSLGSTHEKHRFVFSGIWDVPAGRGRALGANWHPVLDAVAGGWSLSSILTLHSGHPYTVTVQGDPANSGSTNRPNLVGDPSEGPSSINRYFNTSAFARNPLYTFGNLGRNTMIGPGTAVVEFAALKQFQLAKAGDQPVNLQFRFEAFNFFNDVNFGLPNSTLGAAAFGQINGAGSSRKLQFGLKLLF